MAKAGRKPRWTSAEEMQEVIDKYFFDCEGKPLLVKGKAVTDKTGNVVFVGRHPPTITGLALELGFTSRQSLLNYQGKKAFEDTITRAKMRVEEYAERRLYDKEGARGAEFNLTYNFRWGKNEKAEDEEGAGGVVNIPAVMDPAPPPSPMNEPTEGEKDG